MHILILPSAYVNKHNKMSSLFVKSQAEALQKLGEKVGVLCVLPISLKKVVLKNIFKFFNERYEENGVDTYLFTFPSVPKVRFFNNYFRYLMGKKMLKSYIKNNGVPDVIHVHNYNVGNLALWAKKHYSIPFIITEHSSAFHTKQLSKGQLKIARYNYSKSDLNLTVSLGFSEYLTKNMDSVFSTLPNVVDTSFFSLKKTDENKGKFIFTNIGYIDENKNQTLLVDAFLEKFKGDLSKQLVIAGEGPCRNSVLNHASIVDSYNQIVFLPSLNRFEVRDLLHKSDCVVVSSTIETFSVISIEALACGIPVVAINSIGPSYVLKKNKYGILSDKENLGESLNNLFENRNSFDPNYLRRYVINSFSEDVVSKHLRAIYEFVCNRKSN